VHRARSADHALLPFERADFDKYFPKAGILIRKKNDEYWVINLSRGGVIKGYDCVSGVLKANDAGWIARLGDGRVVTSQWNGPDYRPSVTARQAHVSGNGHYVFSQLFTPWRMIVFRAFMSLFGWHGATASRIKAAIRRRLMVRANRGPLHFERAIEFESAGIRVRDVLTLRDPAVTVTALQLGDDFPVRYVPQSRYFQASELVVSGRQLTPGELEALNTDRRLTIETRLCAE
jgi:hypothetical protein